MPRRLLPAIACLAALLGSPASAAAYDHQVSLDVSAGWGWAPALDAAPNNGPMAGLATTVGIDDAWAIGFNLGWAVHPPFTDATDPVFHVGIVGVEGLYYIDILEIVPFFGLGIDLLPTVNGSTWGLDFAAHARVSLDYLVSREVTIGIDVRPYILLTALSLDPVYITFQARVSFLFDY
ncbi:MAG: hypothetical protein H6719_02295 [Sandaracinaceae bacterium]|nr:hypothetical protein [Sandaracinaceae bacterium]